MGSEKQVAIAIDGPAASGKSSVARAVARRLGFCFVNTGAMYRAFTLLVLRRGISPDRSDAVEGLIRDPALEFGVDGGQSSIRLEGDDPGDALSSEAVNRAVSAVSAVPAVRAWLVSEQRRYAEHEPVVMEGRDIGTSVFPETPYKFYLDASPEVRARRRRAQGIEENIRSRDAQDRERKANPLAIAGDAVLIDTSEMGLEQVTERVLQHLREVGVAPRQAEMSSVEPMTPFYAFCKTICRMVLAGLYGMEAHGFDRAKMPAGCFIASNHVSFLDPPTVGVHFEGALHYFARETLLNHALMAKLLPKLNLIPVNQERLDLKTLRQVIKLVRSGKHLVVFPEGHRSQEGKLQAAQPGVGLLIAKTRAPVLPVRIFGNEEIYPPTRKWPRLAGKIHVVCGEPMAFTEDELSARGKDAYLHLAQRVMDEIAQLERPGSGRSS